MAEQKNLRLSVENFGPIREGTIDLKPLTIFIGPNNSGKSYMATLIYSSLKSLQRYLPGAFLPAGDQAIVNNDFERSIFNNDSERMIKLGTEYYYDISEYGWRKIIETVISNLSTYSHELQGIIEDDFGCSNISELIRFGRVGNRLRLSFSSGEDNPAFISAYSDMGKLRVNFDFASLDIGMLQAKSASTELTFFERAIGSKLRRERSSSVMFSTLWPSAAKAIFDYYGIHQGEVHYLPAGRSSIIQAWPAFASLGIQMSFRRFGRRNDATNPFTGIIGDFLTTLFSITSARSDTVSDVPARLALEFLENHVLGGRLIARELEVGIHDVAYDTGKVTLSLQRVSSMVAELAPLHLWIRYVLVPNDLLIIDEPEAHLHPENQRLIARVLVRLVHAGVKVLITTHSSLILHQVSNLLAASQVDEETRQREGFEEADLIGPEDVGVYLFHQKRDGFHIRDVPIKPVFGISEDEFVRVAEEIGDESYRLAAAMPSSEENT